jgi:hypothetical protein
MLEQLPVTSAGVVLVGIGQWWHLCNWAKFDLSMVSYQIQYSAALAQAVILSDVNLVPYNVDSKIIWTQWCIVCPNQCPDKHGEYGADESGDIGV